MHLLDDVCYPDESSSFLEWNRFIGESLSDRVTFFILCIGYRGNINQDLLTTRCPRYAYITLSDIGKSSTDNPIRYWDNIFSLLSIVYVISMTPSSSHTYVSRIQFIEYQRNTEQVHLQVLALLCHQVRLDIHQAVFHSGIATTIGSASNLHALYLFVHLCHMSTSGSLVDPLDYHLKLPMDHHLISRQAMMVNQRVSSSCGIAMISSSCGIATIIRSSRTCSLVNSPELLLCQAPPWSPSHDG